MQKIRPRENRNYTSRISADHSPTTTELIIHPQTLNYFVRDLPFLFHYICNSLLAANKAGWNFNYYCTHALFSLPHTSNNGITTNNGIRCIYNFVTNSVRFLMISVDRRNFKY